MLPLKNRRFPFRSYAGEDPTTSQLREEIEQLYQYLVSDVASPTGAPGSRRTRHRVIINTQGPAEGGSTAGPGSGATGDIGFRSKEGGVYFVRLDGSRVFYQTTQPTEGIEGDLWYDIDNLYRLYEFHNGVWVYVFENVPSLRGRIIGEFDPRTLLDAAYRQEQKTDANAAFVRTYIQEVDNKQSSKIDVVAVRVGAAEASVIVEQTARIAADGTIIASLNTEVTARTNGDNALSASVTTEQTARISADGSLGAEYVLSVSTGGTSGRRVAGFRVTSFGGGGGSTDFVVQTDKFTIVDTSGNIPTIPFKVTGGQVYIDKAVITEVTAGAILAGTVSVALTLTATAITGGSITIGSGPSKTKISSAGANFCDATGSNPNFLFMSDGTYTGLFILTGATSKGFWGHDGTKQTLDLGMSGTMGRIQGVEDLNAQVCKALSSADPHTTDAPLYTAGGAYITKSLDVFGSSNRIGKHSLNADSIEMGEFGSGARNCYIDMHSSDSVDYSTRIIRNSGVNGDFEITQTGSGKMSITVAGGLYVNGTFIA